MLQVVDAERRGFRIGHRAEVPGHLDPARVRRVDRRLQLRPADVHVRLERGDATVRPEVDRLARVGRAGQRMHLDERAVGPLEVRTGHVHVRPRQRARVDLPLHVQVRVGLDAAGSAQRGDAVRQVHPRRAERHLRDQHRFVARAVRRQVRLGDVVLVVVHPDDAGHHAVTGRVDRAVSCRHRVGGPCHGSDTPPFDQHRAVGLRRRARPVDHADADQRHPPLGHADERLDRLAGLGRRRQDRPHHVDLRRRGGGQQQPGDRQQHSHRHPPVAAMLRHRGCPDKPRSLSVRR